jgi:hypothetical protein
MPQPYPYAPQVLRRGAVWHQDRRPAPALPIRTNIDDGQQWGDERRAFYASGQHFSISQGEFALRTVFQNQFGHGMAGQLQRIPANMKNETTGNSRCCQRGYPPSRQKQDSAGNRSAMRKAERAGQQR